MAGMIVVVIARFCLMPVLARRDLELDAILKPLCCQMACTANALDRSGCLVEVFHLVERAIRCLEQGFDGCAILGIDRNANAHG